MLASGGEHDISLLLTAGRLVWVPVPMPCFPLMGCAGLQAYVTSSAGDTSVPEESIVKWI